METTNEHPHNRLRGTAVMKMIRVVLFALAVLLLAACYPFSPTPQQCRQEQHPPYCGCPTTQDPSGFYQPGVVYWPQNPPPLDRCAPV